MGYTRYVYQSPSGVLTLQDNCVEAIIEKPSQEYSISAGVYCVKGSAQQWVPDGRFFRVPT